MTIINELAQRYLQQHPNEAVRSMEANGPEEAAALLAEWPPGATASAIGRMDPGLACDVLVRLPDKSRSAALARLEPHRAIALFRRLAGEEQDRLLAELPPDKSRPLKLLLRYPENTVGSKMDPHYPSLPEDLLLSEALSRVRERTDEAALHWFTLNREQELTGVVSVRDLLALEAGRKVGDVTRRGGHRLSALTDLETVMGSPELRRLQALPVTDEKGLYLGAIREESVRDLIEAEDLHADSVQSAGSALGELYRLGLYGLVYSMEGKPGAVASGKELK